MIVLDASAVLELLLNTEGGRRVAARIADPGESLHAPHLLAVEVTQVLRRYVATRSVPEEIAVAALDDLAGLDVARYAHEPFLPRVWELRANVTAYDAVYLALAEALDRAVAHLRPAAGGRPGHAAGVEVLA